jgi:hypothetical protein
LNYNAAFSDGKVFDLEIRYYGVAEGDELAITCHYFEKNRVFQANLMIMNNEAWDNIEMVVFGLLQEKD